MRLATIVILNFLLLSFSLAPCQAGSFCAGEAPVVQEERAHSCQEEHHCCADSPDQESGTEEGHCPPSCECTCCPAPAVAMARADKLPLPALFGNELLPFLAAYQFDFQYLIWHPPQFQ